MILSWLKKNEAQVKAYLIIFGWLGLFLGPMVTHVVNCWVTGKTGLLVAGIMFGPIGWVNGIGIIFGVW